MSIDFFTNFLTAALLFVGVFFLLVGVHEWGHYKAARVLGVRVKNFSIGMGPKVVKYLSKRSGIEYSLSAIPLGGYVAFQEDGDTSHLLDGEVMDESRSFNNQPKWKKSIIVSAGPAMNFIFSIVLLTIVGLIGTEQMKPYITNVVSGSIADKSGFKEGDLVSSVDGNSILTATEFASYLIANVGNKVDVGIVNNGVKENLSVDLTTMKMSRENSGYPTFDMGFVLPTYVNFVIDSVNNEYPSSEYFKKGDKILSVNGKDIFYLSQLSSLLSESGVAGKPANVLIERDGILLGIPVKPSYVEKSDSYVLGVQFESNEQYSDFFVKEQGGLVDSFVYGVDKTLFYTTITVQFIKKLFTQDISFNMISGPVGIAKATDKAASIGIVAFLTFIALVSTNLGVMNLFPMPGLDGGHLLLYFVEFIRGKKLNEKAEKWMFKISATLIIFLMISALYVDFVYS